MVPPSLGHSMFQYLVYVLNISLRGYKVHVVINSCMKDELCENTSDKNVYLKFCHSFHHVCFYASLTLGSQGLGS